MDEFIRSYLNLEINTKKKMAIIITSLVFPTLFIIITFYFQEYMKYDLIKIVILSIVINICIFSYMCILALIVLVITVHKSKKEMDQMKKDITRLRNMIEDETSLMDNRDNSGSYSIDLKNITEQLDENIIDKIIIDISYYLIITPIAIVIYLMLNQEEMPTLNTLNLLGIYAPIIVPLGVINAISVYCGNRLPIKKMKAAIKEVDDSFN